MQRARYFMKSFADLVSSGIVHDNASNYYACKRISIDEITNKEITILSVVQNIKTENTAQGAFSFIFPRRRLVKENSLQMRER